MKRFIFFIILSLYIGQAFAQYESEGLPLQFRLENKKLRRSVSEFFVDINADTTKISLESSQRVLVSGVTCPVDISVKEGQTFVENGLRVYRVGLKSENAKGISIFFDKFLLPEGGKLFVYNPDQSIVFGAFTSLNNNEKNQLLVRPLTSDSLVVEYQEPLNAQFEADLHISLATHELRAVNKFLISNSCSPHAAQEEKAALLKQSVCLLYMVGTTTSYLGTGSLINNPEHKPYVFTAGHNIKDAGLATRTIYYFNYETPAQDSTFQGCLQFTISGSKLLSNDLDVDFALVELNKMPPAEYRPYMAGWTRQTPIAPLMSIQHPNGDVKKVSYSFAAPTITYFDNPRIKKYWWIKKWDKGITEAGSSGSPLFDNDGYIVGELTAGSSFCDKPYDDMYCMFSAAWNYHSDNTKHLVSYLDPQGENIMFMQGYDPYASLAIERISNVSQGDNISINRVNKSPIIGHNSLGYTEYAEKFELEDAAYVYGAYMMPFKGSYNVNSPITLNVYSGHDKPEELLSSVVVHPTEAKCTRSGVWSETDITKFNKQEIYVSLPKPVIVEDNLFISLQIKYNNLKSSDSLAMATVVDKDECTAYYYDGEWMSFKNHPVGDMNVSMWVDPLISKKNIVNILEISESQTYYQIYPNPTNGNVFVTPTYDGGYKLYNLAGNLVSNGVYNGRISLPEKGFYILELHSKSSEKETHKIICH